MRVFVALLISTLVTLLVLGDWWPRTVAASPGSSACSSGPQDARMPLLHATDVVGTAAPTPEAGATAIPGNQASDQPGRATPMPHTQDVIGAPSPTPSRADADGDQVPDHQDNCPLLPNPQQIDVNSDGLGDECDAPFARGFAYVTPGGVVQALTDSRLRPTQLLAPTGRLQLVWSGDASQLELTVQLDSSSYTTIFDVDLSDNALLQSIEAIEAEAGRDLARLRAWLRDNPGRVLAVARGEQPPPWPPHSASSAAPRCAGLAVLPPRQVRDQLPKVRAYLDNLAHQSLVAFGIWYDFEQAHPAPTSAPWLEVTRNVLRENMETIDQFFDREAANCSPCSVSCRIDCGAGKGACFTNHPEPFPCYEIAELDCRGETQGVFYAGQTCPGACWFHTLGKKSCSTQVSQADCLAIPDRSRASGGNADITTTFCPGRTCDEQIDERCRNSP